MVINIVREFSWKGHYALRPPTNPTCIGLPLTKKPRGFQIACVSLFSFNGINGLEKNIRKFGT